MLTKTELIDTISRQTGVPRSTIRPVLNSLRDVVWTELAAGEAARPFEGIILEPRMTTPRTLRHVKTGEPVEAPPKTRVYLRTGKPLREFINKEQ